MNTSKQKQVHLSYLGITAVVLYNVGRAPFCRVGLAVMSPMDRLAQQLIDPVGADPWSAERGTAIARGRAQTLFRDRTALRGVMAEAKAESMLEALVAEDEALKYLLKIARQNEWLFTRMASVTRALRHVRSFGVPVGRTWDRRIALAFGAVCVVKATLPEEAPEGVACAGD